MAYDLTMTAALRADYVEKSLMAVKDHVSAQPANVFVNIDPAGPESTEAEVIDTIISIYPDAVIFSNDSPSFPLAVKRLWSAAVSPVILHVEDSKWLDRTVDVDWALNALEELAVLNLKFFRNEWERVGPPNPMDRPDGIISTDYYDKAVCMQPSFWRADVARTLAGWMKHGVSPEKTIRPGLLRLNPDRAEVIEYMRQFRFGFVTNKRNEFWYERKGPAWRQRVGYSKKGRDGIPDTWKTN